MNIVGQLGKLEKAILIGDDKINDIHVSVVDWPDDPQEIEQNTIKNAQKKRLLPPCNIYWHGWQSGDIYLRPDP